MIDIKKIQRGLINLVGLESNIDQTSSDQFLNIVSPTSGLFINSVSPYITFENLHSVAPKYEASYLNDYSSSKIYQYGDMVKDGTKEYKYINEISDSGNTVDDNDYWELSNQLTRWAEKKIEAGISRTLRAWSSEKFSNRTAKGLLETKNLFNTGYSNVESGPLTGHSGLEILPRRSKSAKIKIHSIKLNYTTSGTISLKLYKYGNQSAQEIKSITYTTGKVEQIEILNWDISGDGTYCLIADTSLIGYNMTKDYDYYSSGAESYGVSKFARIVSFDSMNANADKLHDITKNQYTTSDNYGMNISFSAYCDYTDLILEQKEIFAESIMYAVAIDLLNTLAASAEQRINQSEARLDYEELKFEILGDNKLNQGFSLHDRFNSAIKSIQFDYTGIDAVCLPKKSYGVKYKSV